MYAPPAWQPTAISPLKVAGAWLLDDQGRRRRLRGINLGGSSKVPIVLEIDSDPTVLAPTVVYVPRRHYPAGPEVAITNGLVEFQPAEQSLLWHAAESGYQTLMLR